LLSISTIGKLLSVEGNNENNLLKVKTFLDLIFKVFSSNLQFYYLLDKNLE
jgi:hypothetical protein